MGLFLGYAYFVQVDTMNGALLSLFCMSKVLDVGLPARELGEGLQELGKLLYGRLPELNR